ncbi:MAG: response regulator transcription factor [Planctomycetota bacterium]|nr:response regulator transcription factor [Planctomycetota bacterium]
MSGGAVRVMCVDDHALVVEGLRARLADEEGLEFCGSLGTLEKLNEEIARLTPGILLLDIELPGPDVFEVMSDLRKRMPSLKVVVFSAFVRDHYIDAAVRAGAWGYLSKGDSPDELVASLRNIARGHVTYSPGIRDRVQRMWNGSDGMPGTPTSKLHTLTPREQQILRMIGKGMSRMQIAEAIHRSPKTVDAHRASIMEKLGIHDRVELARYAIREGLAEICGFAGVPLDGGVRGSGSRQGYNSRAVPGGGRAAALGAPGTPHARPHDEQPAHTRGAGVSARQGRCELRGGRGGARRHL